MNNIGIRINVDHDQEEEELVIQLTAGNSTSGNRLRPVDASLLLYLLAPDWDGWTESAEVFCEIALATDPSVGLIQAEEHLLLSLPHGHLEIPTSLEPELTNGLKQMLVTYTDRLGIE